MQSLGVVQFLCVSLFIILLILIIFYVNMHMKNSALLVHKINFTLKISLPSLSSQCIHLLLVHFLIKEKKIFRTLKVNVNIKLKF